MNNSHPVKYKPNAGRFKSLFKRLLEKLAIYTIPSPPPPSLRLFLSISTEIQLHHLRRFIYWFHSIRWISFHYSLVPCLDSLTPSTATTNSALALHCSVRWLLANHIGTNRNWKRTWSCNSIIISAINWRFYFVGGENILWILIVSWRGGSRLLDALHDGRRQFHLIKLDLKTIKTSPTLFSSCPRVSLLLVASSKFNFIPFRVIFSCR